jgi:hypothetical protein
LRTVLFAYGSHPLLTVFNVLLGALALGVGSRLVRSGEPMADRPNWLRIVAGSLVGGIGLLALLDVFVLGPFAFLWSRDG